MELPARFVERVLRDLGEAEGRALCAALDTPSPVSIRLNPAKCGADGGSCRIPGEDAAAECAGLVPGKCAGPIPGACAAEGADSRVPGTEVTDGSAATCDDAVAGLLRRLCASPAAALLVARQDGHIVGMLTLAWYDAPSGRKAWIEDVVVDAAARGSGAGEALVRAALERARREEADCVMLTSSAARTAARSLYRKVGFVEAETSVFTLKREKI